MKKQKGFSIIELMVGLVLGLVVLVGAGGLFSTTLASNSSTVKQQRFDQTVQVLLDLMSSDIRRAGYANHFTLADATSGTAADATKAVTLAPLFNGGHYFASATCLLLTNSTPTANQRFYGYKLLANVVYRYDGAAEGACGTDMTGWSAVTELSHIKVTTLWFDAGKVDLASPHDCSAAPVGGADAIPRITLGAEAAGLNASGSTPAKRCYQINVVRRNS